MKLQISKQRDGTALTDEELKAFTAMLVKLGYTVTKRKEKTGKGSVSRIVIEAVENE